MTDEIQINDMQHFRPRFDSIHNDSDRLMEHIIALADQGHLQREKGKSLHDLYGGRADLRLIDAYFARGLYAEIETHFDNSPPFGWPETGKVQAMERLVAAGQAQRAIRILRTHLSQIKPVYWERINTRNRGFELSETWHASEAAQRANHEELIAAIPRYKSELLAMMEAAAVFFEYIGASDAQLARLAAERAEVKAEKRQKPAGKPDPRAMDANVFWEVIGHPCERSTAAQIETLPDRLARFKATAIKAFDAMLHEMEARAYRTDIWALAYLLNDGCSDDDFAAFRCWLILQGRDVFEAALAEPDTFDVSRFESGFDSYLSLLDVPLLAHEMRQGKPMKRKKIVAGNLGGPDLDENEFAGALPRVAAALNRLAEKDSS
ncbi:MAG TPA: DUF4240 domain-containing protein [Roseovarius sp.]